MSEHCPGCKGRMTGIVEGALQTVLCPGLAPDARIAALEAELIRISALAYVALGSPCGCGGLCRCQDETGELAEDAVQTLVEAHTALEAQLAEARRERDAARRALEHIADWSPEPTLAYRDCIQSHARQALAAGETETP